VAVKWGYPKLAPCLANGRSEQAPNPVAQCWLSLVAFSFRLRDKIAQFMGNTEMRGKVIWFLLTCRPDLLLVDLKRQGRAEEHIALFYPHTDEERLAMLHAVLKKTGVAVASPEAEAVFLKHVAGLSGADVKAILTRASMKNALANQAGLDAEDLTAALGFHPAVVSHGDRAANARRRAGVYQQEPAAGGIPHDGPRRDHPPDE